MALTINQFLTLSGSQSTPGAVGFVGVVELFGDTSYPTGGYVFPFPAGFTTARFFVPLCTNVGVVPAWDQVNSKIKLFFPTGGGGAEPSSLTAPILASGATAVTSSAATAPISPGIGIELANATNVSTVKIYALVALN